MKCFKDIIFFNGIKQKDCDCKRNFTNTKRLSNITPFIFTKLVALIYNLKRGPFDF